MDNFLLLNMLKIYLFIYGNINLRPIFFNSIQNGFRKMKYTRLRRPGTRHWCPFVVFCSSISGEGCSTLYNYFCNRGLNFLFEPMRTIMTTELLCLPWYR